MMISPLIEQIAQARIVSVLRGDFKPISAIVVTDLLAHYGFHIYEFTTNSTEAFEAMGRVKTRRGDTACVGMGTVLNVEMAARAADAGAEFLVAPSFSRAVLEWAQAHAILYIPGVLTPTECVDAWAAGARLLKLFPIGALGIDYFRTLRAPLDHMAFMCNGGIDGGNTAAFLNAGAVACGIAGWLTGDGNQPVEALHARAKSLRGVLDRLEKPYAEKPKRGRGK